MTTLQTKLEEAEAKRAAEAAAKLAAAEKAAAEARAKKLAPIDAGILRARRSSPSRASRATATRRRCRSSRTPCGTARA